MSKLLLTISGPNAECVHPLELQIKATTSTIRKKRTHRAIKHKGVLEQQTVVLGDRKIVHHGWGVDLVNGHISDDLAILVCHAVVHKGSVAAVVPNEDHLACSSPHRPWWEPASLQDMAEALERCDSVL